ncbi:MAG: sigma-70 family RNA polymerase sigma factor [Chloroflexales bacterium]|nr:sigma-70 family RNA polymerase sigma factor [Chloroflexales bacterium]
MNATQWHVAGTRGPEIGLYANEDILVEGLRNRDETAFDFLFNRYHMSLTRLAMAYVPSRAVAEEVVQETWMGVLQGIGRFERRSSLKTWLFRILTNRAKTRGEREGRSIPFSAFDEGGDDHADVTGEPERFLPAEHPNRAGQWTHSPPSWETIPEDRLLSQETRRQVEQVIVSLPPNQQMVITLRDIEGWSAEEVCNALAVSEANQRVLLHRARARVRRALEQYLAEE